jgi:hypothetical protein
MVISLFGCLRNGFLGRIHKLVADEVHRRTGGTVRMGATGDPRQGRQEFSGNLLTDGLRRALYESVFHNDIVSKEGEE